MKALINGSLMHYAAIQVRCADGPAEHFVISYTSEQALRNVLAASSIMASGCTTRERAEELCREESATRDWSQQTHALGVSGPSRLAGTLRVVFNRNENVLLFLSSTWRKFSEKLRPVGAREWMKKVQLLSRA
jgi:hypothetical protein